MVDLETGKCPHDCGISGNFLFFSPLSRICLPAALALFITFLFFLRGRRVVLVMAESTTQEGNAKCIMCGHCYGERPRATTWPRLRMLELSQCGADYAATPRHDRGLGRFLPSGDREFLPGSQEREGHR